jgi:membrane-associated PAP2 superfamily phosphatase
MSVTTLKLLSGLCFFGGFASIGASILIWFLFKDPDPAYGQRFGIFVGLWAPTFFALSDRFDRYAVVARVPSGA